MRILVDENIPRLTVTALLAMGHEVLDLRGTADQGMRDASVWETAQREQALLVTTGKGFGRRQTQPHYGVLVIRLRQPSLGGIHGRVMQAIAQFGPAEWRDRTVVMRDRAQTVYQVKPR